MQNDETNIINYLIPTGTLLIGWMLGYLQEYIKNRKIKKEILQGIKEELKEAKYRMAQACFDYTIRYKKVSDITLEWTKWMRNYYEYILLSGEYSLHFQNQKIIDTSKYNDEEFYRHIIDMKKGIDNKISSLYPEIVFPYLESNYSSLSQLGEGKLKQITKLRRYIDIINQNIRYMETYTKVGYLCSKEHYNSLDFNTKLIEDRMPRWYELAIRTIEKLELENK